MSSCRFFRSGKCRYGSRCRFSHEGAPINKTVATFRTESSRSSSSSTPKRPLSIVNTCIRCFGPCDGIHQLCTNCKTDKCGYCINRPGANGRNLVTRTSLKDNLCCEECKDYYCIKHTTRLMGGATYHSHVICKDCCEKCFYCAKRTIAQGTNNTTTNKKISGQDCCSDCLDYFCKAHNWNHAKNLTLKAPICLNCKERCWACHLTSSSITSLSKIGLCNRCSESYCSSCNKDNAKTIKNTFRCAKCSYLHGCVLTVHGDNNQDQCSCRDRRYAIQGVYYCSLPADLIDSNYEVAATYEVVKQDHDGYCSDHLDDTTTEMTVTKIYPLPINFTPESVDRSFYQRDDDWHGNGYCGLKTTYGLIDLEVVKKGTGRTSEKIKKTKHRNKETSEWSTDENESESDSY